MLEALQRRLRKLLKTDDVNALVEELLIALDDDAPAEFPNGILLTQDDGVVPISVRNFSSDLPILQTQPHGSDTFGPTNFGNVTGGSVSDSGEPPTVAYEGVIQSGSGTTYAVRVTGATKNVNATLVGGDAAVTIPAGTKVLVVRSKSLYYLVISLQLVGEIGGGSGDTYTVTLSNAMGTISATLPDGDPSLAIPTGTPVAVSRLPNGTYVLSPISLQLTGVIAGGTGSAYTVTLNDGMGTIPVTQLQIDPGETIPAGTAVTVFRKPNGAFVMQSPIWL